MISVLVKKRRSRKYPGLGSRKLMINRTWYFIRDVEINVQSVLGFNYNLDNVDDGDEQPEEVTITFNLLSAGQIAKIRRQVKRSKGLTFEIIKDGKTYKYPKLRYSTFTYNVAEKTIELQLRGYAR